MSDEEDLIVDDPVDPYEGTTDSAADGIDEEPPPVLADDPLVADVPDDEAAGTTTTDPLDGVVAEEDLEPTPEQWSALDPEAVDLPDADESEATIADEVDALDDYDPLAIAPAEDLPEPPAVKWDSYEVQARDTESLGDFFPVAVTDDPDATGLAVTTLEPGKTYELRVRGLKADGTTSAWSDTETIVLPVDQIPPPQPSAPVVVGVPGGFVVSHDGLTSAGDNQPADYAHTVLWSRQGTATPFIVDKFTGAFNITYNSLEIVQRSWWVTTVDKAGNASTKSAEVSGQPSPLVDDSSIRDALDDAQQAIDDASAQAQADLDDLDGRLADTRLGMENLRDVRLPDLQDALNSGLTDANEWREVGAISSKSLAITDFENIFPEQQYWATGKFTPGVFNAPNGTTQRTVMSGSTELANPNGISFDSAVTNDLRYTGGQQNLAGAGWIDHEPGAQYRIDFKMQVQPTASQSAIPNSATIGRFMYDWIGADGAYTYSAAPFITHGPNGNAGLPEANTGTLWTIRTGSIVINPRPNERGKLRFLMSGRVGSAALPHVANLRFFDVRIRRMNAGRLLVDGSVEARHIVAEAVAAAVGEFIQVGAENVDTEELWAALAVLGRLQAEQGWVGGVNLADGAVTAGKITASEELTAKVAQFLTVKANHLDANEIWSNSAWLGQARFESEVSGNRVLINSDGVRVGATSTPAGIDITRTGLTAKDSAGGTRLSMSATTGDLSLYGATITAGQLRTAETGRRVTVDNNGITTYNEDGSVQSRLGSPQYNNSLAIRSPDGMLKEIGPHIYGSKHFAGLTNSYTNLNPGTATAYGTPLGATPSQGFQAVSQRYRVEMSFYFRGMVDAQGQSTSLWVRLVPANLAGTALSGSLLSRYIIVDRSPIYDTFCYVVNGVEELPASVSPGDWIRMRWEVRARNFATTSAARPQITDVSYVLTPA